MHTYYEEPLKGMDDGKSLNIGKESVLPDKDAVTTIGTAAHTTVSGTTLKNNKAADDCNVMHQSVLKRVTTPKPKTDATTSFDNAMPTTSR